MVKILVTKRDGRKEKLDLEKLHKVVFWATEGITGVSSSELEIKGQIQFYNGISSSDIQETLIRAAADLITEEATNYQYVAGRLINHHLRKQVYGKFEPDHVLDLIKKNVKLGYYEPELLNWYTQDEWEKINNFIKHDRDNELTYVAMEQMRGKYLVQNRVTKQVFETPQICYILIAATLFHSYPANQRMGWIKEYYESISSHEISLPTPVMAGVRTPQRQFSSCVLIETADSLDSINATTSAIVKYVSQKAGIGVGGGSIRAINSPIRNGDTAHTGVIPFFRMFQSAVKSCSQGGVRGGAATLYYPAWHFEAEDLLVLKNNKGTNDNRIRQMDYGVQFNKLMYERLLTSGDITLFSPSDVPGMYEAFFNDQDKFKELYEKAERNTKIRKKTVKAIDLFSSFMTERKETGRIYLQNVDNANSHSSFDEYLHPIRQSNLCAEIDLPTKPLKDLNDPDGRIALCTLSAINWGNVKSPADFERPCRVAIRGLDALLKYQGYPVRAAYESTQDFRPLGVGIINFAYWLAKNDLTYTNPAALAKVDEWAEAWSYYLIKASADLATEQGACRLSNETKYGKGIVPCDTRKIDIDELVPHIERMDWDGLREQLKATGIRNATTMALMPSETSAQIANATNGIEPPRSLISVKQSKDGILKQVVPEYRRLKNKYELLWDQSSPEGYLKICAVLQKWIDQGISVNTSYNPKFHADEKIPMSTMLQHIIMFYKYGGKQLYYFNTNDGAGEVDVDKMSNSMLQSTKLNAKADDFETAEEYDAYCESCVI
jgi:ribonucleoside-diphosphate reductase alpha chain